MIERLATKVSIVTTCVVLCACSAGGTGGPPITSVNPGSSSYSALQFAVGTANLYGSGDVGLNVVSTFRQTDGASATGVNTPAITGPFGITAAAVPADAGLPDPYTTAVNGGPSYEEIQTGGASIAGTPQTVLPGTPECDGNGAPSPFTACQAGIAPNASSFGQSGGVFAMGLAPYNSVAATGQSYSYAPYAQPFYPATTHPVFVPWGGPPAFDPFGDGMGERDGVGAINGVDSFNEPYFLGVAEGITVFDGVTVRTGQYKLNVAISTVSNGGAVSTQNVSATASLPSLAVLPAISTPALSPDANGDGGATFTMSLPPGVSEAYVQIVDYGPGGGPNNGGATNVSNCQGARGTAFAPVYYTIHIANAASASYQLPPSIGPNLATSGGANTKQPSPTLCTAKQNTAAAGGTSTPADDFVVQAIGFDYPIYQAALGLTQATTPQKPQISNAAGTANITISIPAEQDAGGAPVPLNVRRPVHPGLHRIHR